MISFAIVIVVGLAVAILWNRHGRAQAAAPKAAPAIPVVVATAQKGDIGVYVTGLGTVTPLNTIAVKTRVDGQLMTVGYKEGEMVRKGAALAEIDPRPYQVQLEQANAQLVKDQATLQNARVDLDRYESLITKNAVAQQVLQTQRATVAQDEGTIKADQANIDSAKLNIAYCHIEAPLSGRVGLRLVDPGNLVSAAASTTLVVITQTQPISVIFTIPEQQVDEVRAPIKAGKRLHVDALDRDGRTTLAGGDLTTLDNQIDQTTGTLKLRATVPNADEALFPNQFVNARVLVQEKKGVTLVPNAAVQRNGSTTYVYVVKSDQSVTMRTVKLGTVNAEQSEILSGISPNERVVVQGVDKLQEGTKVAATSTDEQDTRGNDDQPRSAPIPATRRNPAPTRTDVGSQP
ncbi:MAG TPA: MdtA/MuxA family multidrug efflux RND transporter periplasmic adaptor subunit [Vicinamibacterales bacterium]